MRPEAALSTDAWVVSRRGGRNPVDPSAAYAFLREVEPTESGSLASVSTLFLTNRECPWRCVMCDLWKNTLEESLPPGRIPQQIRKALDALGAEKGNLSGVRHLKLYNSGSFFDPGAIPMEDYPEIAKLAAPYDRVVVECHPRLVGSRVKEFTQLLGEGRQSAYQHGRLEVAMGLETVHPEALERLNKKMTVSDFQRASERLLELACRIRVFLLIQPPFLSAEMGAEWLCRSMEQAFAAGASVVSLIPTRVGNGAMESLQAEGVFSEPHLSTVESAFEAGLKMSRGQVFVDLWDLERFSRCSHCFAGRKQRLERMNLEQRILPSEVCRSCGGTP